MFVLIQKIQQRSLQPKLKGTSVWPFNAVTRNTATFTTAVYKTSYVLLVMTACVMCCTDGTETGNTSQFKTPTVLASSQSSLRRRSDFVSQGSCQLLLAGFAESNHDDLNHDVNLMIFLIQF